MKEKLKKIYEDNKAKVAVRCDEYHAHSAEAGCLVGPKESVDICLLCEYILKLESRLRSIKLFTDVGD